MRIYNRENLLQLPLGTLFCKGIKWYFENLSIKGDSLDNDFVYTNICNIESNEPDQWINRLQDSLKNGTSYPINNDASRDGLFEESAIFIVFEKKDLEYLINIMKISIEIVNEMD